MRIGFFGLDNQDKKFFLKSLPRDKLFFYGENFSTKKAKNLDIISVFTHTHINQNDLKKLPNLKYITTRSTGYDHIAVEAAKQQKIKVSNVPFYGENTVAEHSFALILALSRRLVAAVNRTKKGSFKTDGLKGFDLSGKTLGVIGTGSIGQHVVKIAKGFSMKVVAYDIKKKKGIKYVSLNNLLKTSDIVSLNVPLNKHTFHLMNEKRLFSMKKGAYLINTARGEIVDTKALVKVLKKKHLAGAGLDVLEKENNLRKFFSNLTLLNMPNVLVTPHNGFNTQEAVKRILDETVKNIKAFKKGKPINLV